MSKTQISKIFLVLKNKNTKCVIRVTQERINYIKKNVKILIRTKVILLLPGLPVTPIYYNTYIITKHV